MGWLEIFGDVAKCCAQWACARSMSTCLWFFCLMVVCFLFHCFSMVVGGTDNECLFLRFSCFVDRIFDNFESREVF